MKLCHRLRRPWHPGTDSLFDSMIDSMIDVDVDVDGCFRSVGQIVPRVVLELQAGVRLSQADLGQLAELLVVEAVQRG